MTGCAATTSQRTGVGRAMAHGDVLRGRLCCGNATSSRFPLSFSPTGKKSMVALRPGLYPSGPAKPSRPRATVYVGAGDMKRGHPGLEHKTSSRGKSVRVLFSAASFSTLIIATTPQVPLADEGGVSFWLPGILGDPLAAVPGQPGWSLETFFYNTNVNAGANVAAAREIQIGALVRPSGSIYPPPCTTTRILSSSIRPTSLQRRFCAGRRPWPWGASSATAAPT
jgi:hypothetical protein